METEMTTTNEATRTSLQIAQYLGVRHSDLLRAIRKMEKVWAEVNERNFSLVEYIDTKGEQRPMYELTFEQTLFVTAKYDDRQRAMLIRRWMELEQHQSNQIDSNKLREDVEYWKDRFCKAASIANTALSMLPFSSTITDFANQHGMTARLLNEKLERAGVIVRVNGNIYLDSKYFEKGLAEYSSYIENGCEPKNYLRWTQIGLVFLTLFIEHHFDAEKAWKIFDYGKMICRQ